MLVLPANDPLKYRLITVEMIIREFGVWTSFQPPWVQWHCPRHVGQPRGWCGQRWVCSCLDDHPNSMEFPELPLIGGIRNHVNHPIGKDCISAESTDNYWVIIYHRSHLLKGTRNGYWPIGTWLTTKWWFPKSPKDFGLFTGPRNQTKWADTSVLGGLPILQVARGATLGPIPLESQDHQGPLPRAISPLVEKVWHKKMTNKTNTPFHQQLNRTLPADPEVNCFEIL